MRFVFLDGRPLGLVSTPRGNLEAIRCRAWAMDLPAAGVRVFVPEIADHEVRRELLRRKARAALRRLDQVKTTCEYAPMAKRRASRRWSRAPAGWLARGGASSVSFA